mmetsp:Transcript_18758/g.37641  ORF Transcript_18758/g.37641 Transcript_18758/m.37641 type:complete len:274 (+) Transcript_18758:1753-2574(+)
MLSRSFVLPVSTWPMMTTMGQRRSSRLRAAMLAASRSSRRFLPSCRSFSFMSSLRFASSSCALNSASRASSSLFFLSLSFPNLASLSFSLFFSVSISSSSSEKPSPSSAAFRASSLELRLSNPPPPSESASQSSPDSASQSSGASSSAALSSAALRSSSSLAFLSSSALLSSSSFFFFSACCAACFSFQDIFGGAGFATGGGGALALVAVLILGGLALVVGALLAVGLPRPVCVTGLVGLATSSSSLSLQPSSSLSSFFLDAAAPLPALASML